MFDWIRGGRARRKECCGVERVFWLLVYYIVLYCIIFVKVNYLRIELRYQSGLFEKSKSKSKLFGYFLLLPNRNKDDQLSW